MSKASPITTARDAIDILGEGAIAAAVGVSSRTVRNKGVTGFPSWWYPAVNELAKARGERLDYAVFNFRRAA